MKKLLIILFLGLFSLSGCSFNSENTISPNTANSIKYTTTKTGTDNTNINSINNPDTETQISSFSTKIYDKSSGRQNNIKITISKLNGITIAPNEEFSFCNIVGKATAEKGYEKAKIFDKDGNVTEGYRWW